MTETSPALLSNVFDKKQLRLIKNRQAADLSRKRKKQELENLKQRVAMLEQENERLKDQNEALKRENELLKLQPQEIKQQPLENDVMLSNISILGSPSSNMSDSSSETYYSPVAKDEKALFESLFNLDYNTTITSIFSIFLFSIAGFLKPFQPTASTDISISSSPLDYSIIPWTEPTQHISLATDDRIYSQIDQLTLPSPISEISKMFRNEIQAKFIQSGDYILLEPDVKIVPYYQQSKNENLKLSLLSRAPVAGLGSQGQNGILRLDLEVFRATWLFDN